MKQSTLIPDNRGSIYNVLPFSVIQCNATRTLDGLPLSPRSA